MKTAPFSAEQIISFQMESSIAKWWHASFKRLPPSALQK
uniref:Uncharacterized protein n=1 Tax=Rhizophora mucronata TaxID=61149 RepID=A0A2P2J3A5_RHIMU